MDIGKKFFAVSEVKRENKDAEARGDADGGTLGAPLRTSDLKHRPCSPN